MSSEPKQGQDHKGVGWAFPPRFGRGGASVEMVSGDDDILESLRLLLATEPGERVMRPSFGCNLSAFVFEEVDQGLISRITRTVSDAILNHEPRVILEQVEVARGADSTGSVMVRISYRSRLTNSRYNLVYPFYLREAALDPTSVGS
jgi:phage baseplate assembly protein W